MVPKPKLSVKSIGFLTSKCAGIVTMTFYVLAALLTLRLAKSVYDDSSPRLRGHWAPQCPSHKTCVVMWFTKSSRSPLLLSQTCRDWRTSSGVACTAHMFVSVCMSVKEGLRVTKRVRQKYILTMKSFINTLYKRVYARLNLLVTSMFSLCNSLVTFVFKQYQHLLGLTIDE